VHRRRERRQHQAGDVFTLMGVPHVDDAGAQHGRSGEEPPQLAEPGNPKAHPAYPPCRTRADHPARPADREVTTVCRSPRASRPRDREAVWFCISPRGRTGRRRRGSPRPARRRCTTGALSARSTSRSPRVTRSSSLRSGHPGMRGRVLASTSRRPVRPPSGAGASPARAWASCCAPLALRALRLTHPHHQPVPALPGRPRSRDTGVLLGRRRTVPRGDGRGGHLGLRLRPVSRTWTKCVR